MNRKNQGVPALDGWHRNLPKMGAPSEPTADVTKAAEALRDAIKATIGKPMDKPKGDMMVSLFGDKGVFPITEDFVGTRFTVVRNGVRHATPLLLALLTIEIADAVFAMDSIPAVFGVTTDPLIVFTSNLFAVLGLRSLFFALSGLLDSLVYLKHGLAVVLLAVGAKMLLAAVWTAPEWLTLVLVAVVLGVAVVASLLKNQSPEGIHDAREP